MGLNISQRIQIQIQIPGEVPSRWHLLQSGAYPIRPHHDLLHNGRVWEHQDHEWAGLGHSLRGRCT